jgi:putative tryptophan/tyrosine transport system substrate-binding protein
VNRREFIALLGGAAASPLAMCSAMAQPADRVRRIAMLSGFVGADPEAQARIAALREGLKELGWTEGRNLSIDFRSGNGQAGQMHLLAREVVDLRPELVVAVTTPAVAALLGETRTVPILFVNIVDPIGRGFVSNMARPGGNITGFVVFEFSMGGKWLQTLKQCAPGVKRVAMIFNPDTAPFAESFVRVIGDAAPLLATTAIAAPVHDDAELERTVAAFAAAPDGALIVLPDVFTANHREQIVALAARYRLPAVYPYRYFAMSGGLISDGVNTSDLFRRSATYIDRVLKGTNPGDLPVQAPTKFELVINLKTARALGLDVPPMLLARADEVIE